MDHLHLSGVDVVHAVQTQFVDQEHVMMLLSRVGDPKNAFLIYFPLVYGISHVVGRRLMWAAVVAEWLNIVFKWILFGHRPYWWVHENKHLYNLEELDQYHLTCETGPGSPSGHAMVTAAVGYVIMDASKPLFAKRWIPYLLFATFMFPVCLARIFIAAHFPHQVIAGTICGAVLAAALNKFTNIAHWSLQKYIWTAAGLFFTCSGLSWFLGQLGVDFHWSIPLAVKWCAKPEEWISLGTRPYNSIVRTVFVLAGFGVAEYLHRHCELRVIHPSAVRKFLRMASSLIMVMLLESVKFKHATVFQFYLFSALKHTLIPMIVVFVVPFILHRLYTDQTKAKVQ